MKLRRSCRKVFESRKKFEIRRVCSEIVAGFGGASGDFFTFVQTFFRFPLEAAEKTLRKMRDLRLRFVFSLLFLCFFGTLRSQVADSPLILLTEAEEIPDSVARDSVPVSEDVVSVSEDSVSSEIVPMKSVRLPRFVFRGAAVADLYAGKLDSLRASYADWHYAGADTLSNPFYSALFGGPTLYESVLQRHIGSGGARGSAFRAGRGLRSSARIYDIVSAGDGSLSSAYVEEPRLLWQMAEEGTKDMTENFKKIETSDINLMERFGEEEPEIDEDALVDQGELDVVVRKPNFWTFSANVSLQISQTHYSDNWYTGAESYSSMLGTSTLEANYDNQKLIFSNKLEMKLGFQTNKSDTEHKFNTSTDLVRLTNKLGVQATKNWYYTLMLQSWTQFCPNYASNSNTVNSDFMSPFESLLSIGMDYKLTKSNFTLSATLSPLALDFIYVDRLALSTSYGPDEGKHCKWSFGSNITVNYTWTLMKNVSWEGRIYWFTDYKNTKIEWENTFNLTINKYLSTKLYLYPRFDDSVAREEGESYFQFHELLSVGLNVDF